MACAVKGCRFSSMHVTMGHECGSCKMLGHGIQECRSVHRKKLLREMHASDVVGEPCTVLGCATPRLHVTQGHHCKHCGQRGSCSCKHVRCPLCRQVTTVDFQNPIYTGTACCVCLELGSSVVFRACRHACVCVSCARELSKVPTW